MSCSGCRTARVAACGWRVPACFPARTTATCRRGRSGRSRPTGQSDRHSILRTNTTTGPDFGSRSRRFQSPPRPGRCWHSGRGPQRLQRHRVQTLRCVGAPSANPPTDEVGLAIGISARVGRPLDWTPCLGNPPVAPATPPLACIMANPDGVYQIRFARRAVTCPRGTPCRAGEKPAVIPNVPDPAGLEDSGDLFAGEGRVGGDGPSRRDRASRSRHGVRLREARAVEKFR